ncbi:hypothetical protein LK540_10165 [Massilia sp. IC2-278]|nr:hypothetical protein [Massilia sp. IC2-278]
MHGARWGHRHGVNACGAAMDQHNEILRFVFDSRLSLFNTRRDHEWRVIISAMVLMGAVDLTLLSQHIVLNAFQLKLWWVALFCLFVSIAWYQWGVQVRNRVDRVAMDYILHHMCNELGIHRNSDLRAGIDREKENIPHSRKNPIFHLTYLWAFIPQMLVLLVASVLSAYIPHLAQQATPDPPASAARWVPVSGCAPGCGPCRVMSAGLAR